MPDEVPPQPQPAKNNFDKLADLLGFNPLKENPNKSILQKALQKVTEEREQKIQVKVEEQLKKAIEIAQQKQKIDNEYKKQSEKFDKELGNIIKILMNVNQNKEIPPEEEKKEE